MAGGEEEDEEDEDEEDGPTNGPPRKKRGGHGRRKIEIEYIEDKIRRHITFSKRKAGISKKAYELSRLTGAQVLLLISSERGQIYSFATPKLQPILVNEGSKALIEQCLNAPDPMAHVPQQVPMIDAPPQQPMQGQVPHSQGVPMHPAMMGMAPNSMPQGMDPSHMAGVGTLVALQPVPGQEQHVQHMQHPGYVVGPDGHPMVMPTHQMPQQ